MWFSENQNDSRVKCWHLTHLLLQILNANDARRTLELFILKRFDAALLLAVSQLLSLLQLYAEFLAMALFVLPEGKIGF